MVTFASLFFPSPLPIFPLLSSPIYCNPQIFLAFALLSLLPLFMWDRVSEQLRMALADHWDQPPTTGYRHVQLRLEV